ncbi:MAG: hypothetical protein IPP07_15150 [Holophagales bacterium]|nr:hypothetical protein [Holophagales bacterium]
MPSLTPVLSVLRHALADPLSAATAKTEILAERLRREAPGLAARGGRPRRRSRHRGAPPRPPHRALGDLGEEPPEPVLLERLVSPFAGVVAGGSCFVRIRLSSAVEAVRRVVAFGQARGGAVRVSCRRAGNRGEIVFDGLGPPSAVPHEKLLLLPRDVPGVEDLFVARAAALADGGALLLSLEGGGLAARLSWPALEPPP